MFRTLLTFSILIIPTGALALDYTDASKLYTDAPFTPADKAAITLLTNVDAVEGNPDGSFAPKRLINRAEFLKIVMASHPRIRSTKSDAATCFPDVKRDDWFSQYVCLAKKRGIIKGYPDGTFKPAQNVNYVEALKILGELYNYTAYADPGSEWWTMYVQAATNHKVMLPVNLGLDRWINRGQMARLAAAYRAEDEGELDLYRMAERGEDVVAFLLERARLKEEAERLRQEAEETEDTEESEEVEAPEEPPNESVYAPELFPTISRYLMVGERSMPIADGVLYPQANPVKLATVKVFLEKEAKTVKQLFIVDEDGTEIGELKLDITDNDNETWKVIFPNDAEIPVFPGRTGRRFGITAQISDFGDRGFSEERIEVKKFFITVAEADEPAISYQVVPSDVHTPPHFTTMARVTSVRSDLDGGELEEGEEVKIGSYFIGGETIENGNLRITNLHFHVDASQGVELSNFKLKASQYAGNRSCSRKSGDILTEINCLAIPEDMGNLMTTGGKRKFGLFADIAIDDDTIDAFLEVHLMSPGSQSERGDITWTDGSGEFQWVELTDPMTEGVRWE